MALPDTFIVRCILVPAIFGLLGDWNWWPIDPLYTTCSIRHCCRPRNSTNTHAKPAHDETSEVGVRQAEGTATAEAVASGKAAARTAARLIGSANSSSRGRDGSPASHYVSEGSAQSNGSALLTTPSTGQMTPLGVSGDSEDEAWLARARARTTET